MPQGSPLCQVVSFGGDPGEGVRLQHLAGTDVLPIVGEKLQRFHPYMRLLKPERSKVQGPRKAFKLNY